MDPLKVIQEIIEVNDDLEIQISASEIKPEHEYRTDLGLDSLGLMTLAFELQEKYPDLDETAIADWITVGDSIKTLNELS
jgi:acyl carrier protein